jgi:hypothetical protein
MVNSHKEPQEEKAEVEHVDHPTDVVQDDAFYEGVPEPTLTLKVYLAMSVSALTRDALGVVDARAEYFPLEHVVRWHHRPLSFSILLSSSGVYGRYRQSPSCHNDRLADFPHVTYSLLGLNAVSAHRPCSSQPERPACSSAVLYGHHYFTERSIYRGHRRRRRQDYLVGAILSHCDGCPESDLCQGE